MSEGRWSGGAANRSWSRYQGSRVIDTAEDRARGQRLYALLADESFWCETCGQSHPLREHRECRADGRRQ